MEGSREAVRCAEGAGGSGAGGGACACVGACGCGSGHTLAVLRDVQRAYEAQMEVLEGIPQGRRLQAQVELLRSWVGDLVGQNSLLARAVEELEAEATAQLTRERRKHAEIAMELCGELRAARRRLARKDADLRGLLEVLRRLREFDSCTLQGIHFYELTESDIFGSVDIEIRKLNKDAQQYEQTILSLRNEISMIKYHTPDISKKDVSVMVGMGCSMAECGDCKPVKDHCLGREDVAAYQDRIQKMEVNLKKGSDVVRSLRGANVALHEELHALRGQCAALAHVCREREQRDLFKDDIIREMRRQLKHVKQQSKEVADLLSTRICLGVKSRESRESRDLSPATRRVLDQQPRRSDHRQRVVERCEGAQSLSDECRSPRLQLSVEDLLSILPD